MGADGAEYNVNSSTDEAADENLSRLSIADAAH